MSEKQMLKVLEEIRDLQKQQIANQKEAIAVATKAHVAVHQYRRTALWVFFVALVLLLLLRFY